MSIHILDNSIINKIAAGEVVERPASVVKELAENSIDAGADSISIEISGGGIDFIKITDNGKGIPKEQVRTAFLRHATSKIMDFEDLEDVMTLGFRGEALSSISSVSRVEIVTKTKEESVGTRLKIEANNVVCEEETGTVDGTTIIVKNLFFNTPARRKFLKKPSSECGYINDAVSRMALGHPEIAFKYINNKSVTLRTSGSGDIKTCVFHVYGKEISVKTINVDSEKDGYSVFGLIGMPEISRATRGYENFFINGRFIKSKIVSDAVEDAYRGRLMGGRFPMFVLNMSVPPNTVDVNVHPAKLEARFSDENFIYEFIYDTVYSALKDKILIPDIKFNEKNLVENNVRSNIADKPAERKEGLDKNNSFMSDGKKAPLDKGNSIMDKKEIAEQIKSELLDIEDVTSKSVEFGNDDEDFFYNDTVIPVENVSVTAAENNVSLKTKKNIGEKSSEIFLLTDVLRDDFLNKKSDNKKDFQKKEEKRGFFNNYKIVGQIFKTYWIVQQEEAIYMIDQHAAHERILYEELMNSFKRKDVISQRLLQPVAVDLSENEKAVLEDNYELIESFGFEIEEFGKNTFAVKSVPYIFKNPESAMLFKDIIDMLGDKSFDNIYDTRADAVASMACKAAIKGNDSLDYIEAKALIEKVMTLENPFNCPHGRPTIIKITKYDIEKFFKRVL